MNDRYQEDWKRIDRMMRQKGVFTDTEKEAGTGRSYYTGYEYATLYDWDQYFETLVQLYLGWDTTLAKNGVMIFLDIQKENGHIQRSSKGGEDQLSEHVKPFLGQISLLVYNRDGEIDFLRERNFFYYERMKKYLLYWLDNPGNYKGLAFWDSAPHTGMDNQHARAGYWHDSFSCGVDLASYLVRECQAFAELAAVFGKVQDVEEFRARAEGMAEAVRRLLWDEEDDFFHDLDRRTGELLPMKYIGAFAALWAGIATEEMARRMVEKHLKNPAEFDRGFRYPVMSASETGYTEGYLPGDLGCNWRANTWIPTNYYVFEGLRSYGYHDLARELAESTYETVKRVGEREYYATESGTGCGLDPFWGWSLLAYFMPYEAESGFDPTKIARIRNNRKLLNREEENHA